MNNILKPLLLEQCSGSRGFFCRRFLYICRYLSNANRLFVERQTIVRRTPNDRSKRVVTMKIKLYRSISKVKWFQWNRMMITVRTGFDNSWIVLRFHLHLFLYNNLFINILYSILPTPCLHLPTPHLHRERCRWGVGRCRQGVGEKAYNIQITNCLTLKRCRW